MNWANLILAGAPKSGCTTLLNLLNDHPAIQFYPEKDVPVFTKSENLDRFETYSSKFERFARDHQELDYVGDFNPSYFFNPAVPRRLDEKLKDFKLIFLLRDPAERSVSHYWHKHKKFEDTRSFERVFDCGEILSDAIEAERLQVREAIREGEIDPTSARSRYDDETAPFRYLNVSNYTKHLDRFFRRFNPERILLLTTEELAESPRTVLDEVHGFLELETVYPGNSEQHHNPTKVPGTGPFSRLLHNVVKPLVPSFLRKVSWAQSLYNTLGFRDKPATPESIREDLQDLFRSSVKKLDDSYGEMVSTGPWN